MKTLMNKTWIMALALAAFGGIAQAEEKKEEKGTMYNVEASKHNLMVRQIVADEFKSTRTFFLYYRSFKVNDTWSIAPETGFYWNQISSSEADFGASFWALRFVITPSWKKEWGKGKSLKLQYRYTAPYNDGTDSYGTLKIRPRLDWTWGKFSVVARTGLSIVAARNQYDNETGNANGLLAYDFEFIPGFEINDKLSVGAYIAPYFAWTGNARGTGETGLNLSRKQLFHEWSVNAEIMGRGFTFTAGNETSFSDFNIWPAASAYYQVETTFQF